MESIKKKLEAIIQKISDNNIDAWEDDLEDTKDVVILQDFDKGLEVVIYNGWLEELIKLTQEL